MLKRFRSIGVVLTLLFAALVMTVAVAFAALPAGGTFVDDDGNVHEPMIEAIAAEGITAGCSTTPSMYCPDGIVKRSEMAAFIVRAKGESKNVPSYQGYFADVPAGQWYTSSVERLYELGLTSGCDEEPLRFCPNDSVLRTEMAAFLIRDIEGESGLPSYQGYFADVPAGQWYTPWVERLYELDITQGCLTNPARFCPMNALRRDEAASFLGRAYGLEPIAPPPPTTTTTVGSSPWSPVWPEDEGGIRDVEEWRSIVAEYWAADRVDCVLGIIYKESKGDPQAVNTRSDAHGLMQHLARYWDGRAAGAGFEDTNGLFASPYSAEANIAAGAHIATSGSDWYRPWGYTPAYGTCPDSR